MKIVAIENQKLPETPNDFRQLMASSEDWFVRSAADFDQVLGSIQNPLTGIPPEAVEDFRKSLEFKNGGLAHADYSSLVDHIAYKQFIRLWQFFGISPILFSDYDHKWCRDPGVCDNMYYRMCSSNC